MVLIEINGFDESGKVGEDIKFVQVGVKTENELRPLIYNILTFGSVIVTKGALLGQSHINQKQYVRAIRDDPVINTTFYNFSLEEQGKLLCDLLLYDYSDIYSIRSRLVSYNKQGNTEKIWEITDSLKKYYNPRKYLESFVKSYVYRCIIEKLDKTSPVLRSNPTVEYRVISQIAGGYPFMCWWNSFLQKAPVCFSTQKTPIFGISNGDQYFPLPILAGNLASIIHKFPEMNLSGSLKTISYSREIFEEFYPVFLNNSERPRYYPRFLFIGDINENLQFLIPYTHYRNSKYVIYEPFRITHSFKDFYKEFYGKAPRSKDIVVYGKIRKDSNEENLFKEAQDMELNLVPAVNFCEPVNKVLSLIQEEAYNLSIDSAKITKINSVINKTTEIIKKSTI